MSAGLPSVGAHCSLPSCNLNDFLPIRCKCEQLFCRDHIAPDVHSCPAQQPAPGTETASFKLQRCAAQGCNKPSLESFIANSTDTTNRSPAVCIGCSQAYCAQYVLPAARSLSQAADSRPQTSRAKHPLMYSFCRYIQGPLAGKERCGQGSISQTLRTVPHPRRSYRCAFLSSQAFESQERGTVA